MSAPRALRLAEIVERFGGELVGDPDLEITRVATLESAGPGDLSFLAHPRYRKLLIATHASGVILGPSERDATVLPRIVCTDPYLYFAKVSGFMNPRPGFIPGVDATALIDRGARVSASARVGPRCHVGEDSEISDGVQLMAGCEIGQGVHVGDGTQIHALVTVYPYCRIGRRVIVHAGAVIGADGFGMALENGAWLKIPQIGRVIIGDDVEIGANTTIDRGALDDTVIENGVKLDNQIQIGHNVHIGAHTAMAGCVGIAGSTRIGRHCTIGGGAIVLGHLELADHVHISAGTLVTKSVADPGNYTGVYPMQSKRKWARTAALLRNIDSLEARVRALERTIAALMAKD